MSTKNYAPELKAVVPTPRKQYDIVEKRALVLSSVHFQTAPQSFFCTNCLNIQYQNVCMFVCVQQDPFGDHLKLMMSMIHEFMPSTVSRSLREVGTQEYEADVVELEKTG